MIPTKCITQLLQIKIIEKENKTVDVTKRLKLNPGIKKKKNHQHPTHNDQKEKKKEEKLLLALVEGRRSNFVAVVVGDQSVEAVDHHFPIC